VVFYCVVPFMVFAARRFGSGKVLTTIFVASIFWKVGFSAAEVSTGAEIYGRLARQLPGQLCFFAGGAWAYYRTRNGRSISGAIALMGLIAYALSTGWLFDVLAPLAVTALVYWAAIAGPRLPALAKHGDFSYGTYLYHFPLIQSLVALGLFHWQPLLGWISSVLAVGLCAFASWRLVERPMLHRSTAHAQLGPAF
jgi:peptidoglycan/LPS O-acetylase OafA/YrhL